MTDLQTPVLTKDQVVSIAKQVLSQGNWLYDAAAGIRPIWGSDRHITGREGEEVYVWSVGFTTPAEPFDPVDRFLVIDDLTGKPLCILLGPGRYDF